MNSFLTADNIELHINATIFYRVIDVATLFTTRIKDQKDLIDTLHSQAMASLLTIIRSESFQGVGSRSHVRSANREMKSDLPEFETSVERNVRTSATGLMEQPIQPSVRSSIEATATAVPVADNDGKEALESITLGFQNIIHDAEPQFQRMMQNNFGSSGIEIQSLRIEQIEFADKSMQKQVSEFAMTNTKLQSQQQTIKAQRSIQIAEAERDAATLMIKTNAEANRSIRMTEVENQIKIKNADTDNEIKTRVVKTEAANKLIVAEAEAQAKLRIGEAEIKILEKQNALPHAQLRIVTEAQKAVMSGVQKVIYTDQQSMLLKPYLNLPDMSTSNT